MEPLNLKPVHKPATSAKAKKRNNAAIFAVAGLVAAIAGLFVMPNAFVPIAIVCAILGIARGEAIIGGVALFCALVALTMAPDLANMLGLPNIASRFHSGLIDESNPYPQIKDQIDKADAKQGAVREMTAATLDCQNKRLSGELKTHTDSVNCAAPRIKQAFQSINYPHMELVDELINERLTLAAKVDKNEMTEAQAAEADQRFLADLAAERAARETTQP